MRKTNTLVSVLHVLVLCVVITAVSLFFIYRSSILGYVLIALGIFSLLSLKLFRIKISSTTPDIIFGVIDNGILAVTAIIGGQLAGVAGAIVGGAVGNALTDGIAGLFEGYMAEHMANDKRTVLGSSVGKMAGCLLGAGVVLAFASSL